MTLQDWAHNQRPAAEDLFTLSEKQADYIMMKEKVFRPASAYLNAQLDGTATTEGKLETRDKVLSILSSVQNPYARFCTLPSVNWEFEHRLQLEMNSRLPQSQQGNHRSFFLGFERDKHVWMWNGYFAFVKK